eukprot:gene31998-40421_t
MHHAHTPPADESVVLEEPPFYPAPSIVREPPFHESFMEKMLADDTLVGGMEPEPGYVLSMHDMTAPTGVFADDNDVAVIDSDDDSDGDVIDFDDESDGPVEIDRDWLHRRTAASCPPAFVDWWQCPKKYGSIFV